MSAPVLEMLKTVVNTRMVQEVLPCSFLSSGLPRGGITEISGWGKTELTVQFIAEHPQARVAWIEDCFSLFPSSFLQRQIDLERVLFVQAKDQLSWSVLQILKAQIFTIVVICGESLVLKEIRRMQLAAERAGAVVIWLTRQSKSFYPIRLRLQIVRSDQKHDHKNDQHNDQKYEVTILNQKY